MTHRGLPLFALLSLTFAWSTAPVAAEDPVTLSGKQLYERYCAACHGVQGRGDGPVAGSFRIEVPDLTRIARRHGGKYPRDLVERIIDGRHILGAHGTRTMPVWGEDFSRQRIGDPNAEEATRTITLRLADYLWLLQRPEAGTADRQAPPLR